MKIGRKTTGGVRYQETFKVNWNFYQACNVYFSYVPLTWADFLTKTAIALIGMPVIQIGCKTIIYMFLRLLSFYIQLKILQRLKNSINYIRTTLQRNKDGNKGDEHIMTAPWHLNGENTTKDLQSCQISSFKGAGSRDVNKVLPK